MMSDASTSEVDPVIIETAVSAGREAWSRLRNNRKSWSDWLAVGRAVQIGKVEAMRLARTNRAVGSKYNRIYGQWLLEAGLDGIVAQERYRLLLILDNLTAIGTWRAGLDEAKQRRLNHPNAVWAHWQKSLKPAVPKHREEPAAVAVQQPDPKLKQVLLDLADAQRGRPIYWPQSALRRAHQAMLDSRSNDLLVLARAALEAAIPTTADLLELLDPPPRPAPPRRAAKELAPA